MLLPLVLFAAWLLIWLWFFADCLRTDRLHPLWGSEQRARLTWGVLFLAFNPLLVLLYVLLARTRRKQILSHGLRQAIVASGAALGLWLQLGAPGAPTLSGDVKANPPSSHATLAIGFTTFKNSSSVNTMSPSMARAPRTVRVTYSDDALARACALRVARALAAEWWTETVELRLREEVPREVTLAPDLYLEIATRDVAAWPTPFVQRFTGSLQFSASASRFRMGPFSGSDENVSLRQVELNGDSQFSFTRLGSALGSAVYGDPADSLSDWIEEEVITKLRAVAEENGHVPDLPGTIEPRDIEVPGALVARDAVPLGREYGRFIHGRTCFRFEDERRTTDVLSELSSALESEGWSEVYTSTDEGESAVLIMKQGNLRMTVGRWPRPAWQISAVWIDGEPASLPSGPISSAPFTVNIEMRFTRAELEALAARYTREPVHVDGFFALHRLVEGEELVNMLKVVHASPVPSATHWLELARLDKRAGDTQAAVRSARIATSLARMDGDSSVEGSARKLAAELDVALSKDPGNPTYSDLVAAGFQPLVPGGAAQTFSLAPGGRARMVVDLGEKAPTALTVVSRSAPDGGLLGIDIWTDRTRVRMTRPIGQSWTSIFEGPHIKVASEARDGRVQLSVKI